MGKIILRNYETFDEIPEGNMMVKEKSNLMYVRVGNSAFIAREFINSIESDASNIKYIVSYCNVKDNKVVLILKLEKDILNNSVKFCNKRSDIDILPLSSILNIKGTDVTFICLDDIDNIINFKSEFISSKKISVI